jgi:1-acylglycerone phosphate reductase
MQWQNLTSQFYSAGMGYSTPILDADIDFARKVMDVNLFGRVAVTQAFAAMILKSKGIVLNIGSIAAVSPSPWAGMYNASCAAVHQWNDTLRIEMEPFGVRVVLVSMISYLSFISSF